MADTTTTSSDETYGLHNLSPADGSHRSRKRVGRCRGRYNPHRRMTPPATS